MVAGTISLKDQRYRQRWHSSSAPRSNVVKPLFFVAPPTERPDRPCVKCGARDHCRHREPA
jgi:hypothetical protein